MTHLSCTSLRDLGLPGIYQPAGLLMVGLVAWHPPAPHPAPSTQHPGPAPAPSHLPLRFLPERATQGGHQRNSKGRSNHLHSVEEVFFPQGLWSWRKQNRPFRGGGKSEVVDVCSEDLNFKQEFSPQFCFWPFLSQGTDHRSHCHDCLNSYGRKR